jgi:HlyD family secretion protein
VPGRLQQVLVEEGQTIQGGDLIAVIEGDELSAGTAASVAQARSAASQLDAARATAASTAGELTQCLASARAGLAMAIAARAEAQANRGRQEAATRRAVALAAHGALSAQDQDTAVGNLEALEAHERAAARAVEQAQAAVLAAVARSGQGRAARENVNVMAAQFAAARAQVSGAETRLGFTRILAPVGGRVGTLVARQGECVSAGSPVATLMDFRQSWVLAAVPETQADWIQVADHLRVTLPGGGQVEGRVIAKAAEADFATQRDVGGGKRDIRAIRFKVLIGNPDGIYVPGMTAALTVRRPAGGSK